MTKKWKQKLQQFYGKSYSTPKYQKGLLLHIQTGNIITPLSYLRPHMLDRLENTITDGGLQDWIRVDGKHRMTKKGREQAKKVGLQQWKALNMLGIYYIDDNFDFEIIAKSFTNENSPKIKMLNKRLAWAKQ